MYNRRLFLGGTLAALAMFAASSVSATPQSGMSSETLAKGVYGPMNLGAGSDRMDDKDDKWDLKLMTKDVSDVYNVRNTFIPGGHSGWHTHPGPSLITVTAGQITVYEGDGLCQGKTYSAGDGSLDLGSGHAHLIKNEGSVNAVTIVTQIIPHDAPRRIDVDAAPTNCNF
jgi:quercetin dioxygenase-like cupin family protein